jgi:hypothetical protein
MYTLLKINWILRLSVYPATPANQNALHLDSAINLKHDPRKIW